MLARGPDEFGVEARARDLTGRRVDPATGEILGPSLYAELIWQARQYRAQSGVMGGIDWVVTRNRLSSTNAKNKQAMEEKLKQLSERVQFRVARGFGERVIYRELFTNGMTLLDLGGKGAPRKLGSMSHLAARQEVRGLLASLRLPQVRDEVQKDLAPDQPERAAPPVAEVAQSAASAPAEAVADEIDADELETLETLQALEAA